MMVVGRCVPRTTLIMNEFENYFLFRTLAQNSSESRRCSSVRLSAAARLIDLFREDATFAIKFDHGVDLRSRIARRGRSDDPQG
jgi:hypothetical protein